MLNLRGLTPPTLNLSLLSWVLLLVCSSPAFAQQPLLLDFKLSEYQSSHPEDWPRINEAAGLTINNRGADIKGMMVFNVYHEGELLLTTDTETAAYLDIEHGDQRLATDPINRLWKDLKIENYQDLERLQRRNGKLKPNKKCWICAVIQDEAGNKISNEDCEWIMVPPDVLPPQIIYPMWGNSVQGDLALQIAPPVPIAEYCTVKLYEKDPRLSVEETVKKRKPLYEEQVESSGVHSISSEILRWKANTESKDMILTVTSVEEAKDLFGTMPRGSTPFRVVEFTWQNPSY